jgi:hypothetical protein
MPRALPVVSASMRLASLRMPAAVSSVPASAAASSAVSGMLDQSRYESLEATS